MRAWDGREREADGGGTGADPVPAPGDPGTLAELGLPPGAHRHGDEVHLEAHRHPHVEAPEDGRPVLGFIGAGPVATALAVAFQQAGWIVGATVTRDEGRGRRFRSLVPGARVFPDPRAIVDECHLVIVAVPDDAIADVAARVRLYSGQAIVHTSGALDADVLAPSLAAGTQAGSMHPLIAFADVERAVEALRGCTVAVEGEQPLLGLLGEMADSIGARPVALPPGSKPAYHAAAVLAAAGTISLLDTIAELGRVAGLDEARSLAIYLPLVEGTIANARALGISKALTGPMTRGDVGTLEAHVATLAAHAPEATALHREVSLRAIGIAQARGAIDAETASALRAAVAGATGSEAGTEAGAGRGPSPATDPAGSSRIGP